jgi:LemA protein
VEVGSHDLGRPGINFALRLRFGNETGVAVEETFVNNVILLGFAFFSVGALWYAATMYNGLIGLKNDIDKAWSNIDILLKQRHDELTKLLDACKGYMDYERDTLQKITQARSLYQQAVSMDQKAQADQSMTSALHGFFAVAENYPELKADRNFVQLQTRITELENQIADRREFYNDSVNTFNIRIQQVPDTFVAAFMTLKPRGLFKVEAGETADVPMSFGAKA